MASQQGDLFHELLEHFCVHPNLILLIQITIAYNYTINIDIKAMENLRTNKFMEIKNHGKETEIKLFVMVEFLRFLFYLWFIILILIGTLLNLGFVEEDYRKFMNHFFGSVSICVCFNAPPASFVLPILYAIWPVIVFLYCICSIFRALIALGD